jgi:DNA-binding NtrC family response regulator
MDRATLPRVLYCSPEDGFYKRLSQQRGEFVLESRAIPFRGSPQKLAQSRKATVLLVRIKNEFDLKYQEWLSRNDASVPIIVLCQNGTVQTAVHALQYGVFDYFCMNQDMKLIIKRIEDAIDWKSCPVFRRKSEEPEQLLLGNNARIREINEQAQDLARERHPLVLYGETGSGKQHLAYGMYRISNRDFTPFVHYDCRLLQHVSRYDRISLNELIRTRLKKLSSKALKGVLYLSHLEQLNGDQQKEVFGNWPSSTVRLIAAYQEVGGPHTAVRGETSLASVKIPSLRQHTEDIPMMAEHFMRKTAHARKMRQKSLSLEVVQLMQEYPWPGNVQELSNVVERMMTLEPSTILSATSWRISQGSSASLRLDNRNHLSMLIEEVLKDNPQWENGDLHENFMDRMEKMLIELVMPRVDNNRAAASKILGISRNTLRAKLRA